MLDGVPVSVAVAEGTGEKDATGLALGLARAVREGGAEAEGLPSGVPVRLPVGSALLLPQALKSELSEREGEREVTGEMVRLPEGGALPHALAESAVEGEAGAVGLPQDDAEGPVEAEGAPLRVGASVGVRAPLSDR